VLLGVACATATLALFRGAFVDDAYISLRYARHLLLGDGLVFNAGERVEGFTNLGHVLAVAGLGALGVDLEAAARLLGIAGLALAVTLGPAAILPGPEHRLARSIARLLCLANFPFVFLSATGMETGLYAGVVATAAWLFSRGAPRLGVGVGVGLALAWLIRPDGLLIGAAFAMLVALRRGRAGLMRSPGLWIWAGSVLATELWRLAYYGAWLPHTAHVKGAAGILHVTVPWYGLVGDDAVEFLAGTGGALALLPLLVALWSHPDRERIRLACAVCIAVVAFELYAGGDWMRGYRFLLPMLPFYLSLVSLGLLHAQRRIVPADPSRGAWVLAAAVAVVAGSCWSFGLEFRSRADEYPEYHMTSRPMAAAASWLAERYPERTSVHASYIGALGYFTRLVVIDDVGLTDAVLGRNRSPERRSAYLHERNPDLVLLTERPGADFQTQRVFWGRRYAFVRSFPMGVEAPWLLFERSDLGAGAGQE
jgi:hypothetical protein